MIYSRAWHRKVQERGLAASTKNAHGMADFPQPNLAWLVRVSLPYSSAASKNALYGRRTRGRKAVFIRSDARNYRDAITLLVRSAVKNVPLRHDKLWIDIFVEKPNNYGDAVNVIDTICDAIKAAIPIDDRWYSIRWLDWAINKVNPHLFIGLGQEAGTDSKTCAKCGQIRPLSDFTFDKSDPRGRGHVCIKCRRPSYKKGPNKVNRILTESSSSTLPSSD